MKKLAILLFIGLFLISCAQTEKEISFNTVVKKNGFVAEYYTEIYFDGKKSEELRGSFSKELFNKEKTRAVVQHNYYTKEYRNISDILYFDSKTNTPEKLFANMPSSLGADDELKYLFVADYTNQGKTGTARIFIYDLLKREIINETEHHSPDGGYTLKKVVYENGEFKYSLMNDVEHTQTFSLVVK